MFAARGRDMSDFAENSGDTRNGGVGCGEMEVMLFFYQQVDSATFSPPLNVPPVLFLHVCPSVGITLRLK